MTKTFLFQAIQFSQTVLIKQNQFCIGTYFSSIQIHFYSHNQFYLKQFNFPWIIELQKSFLFQSIQFIQTVLIQLIQFSISIDFLYTQLNVKTFLY